MLDRTQHLSLATSSDGIHFAKQLPNPFASPPSGLFALRLSRPLRLSRRRDRPFPSVGHGLAGALRLRGLRGCLAHLVSPDLAAWEVREPFLITGYRGAPECPDYFRWHDWYYLRL